MYSSYNLFCRRIAAETLNDLILWLSMADSELAVFDATNTTRERRDWVVEECVKNNFDVIFVESICNDEKIIEENVLVNKCCVY